MEEIISKLVTLLEDKPSLILTDDDIKSCIEDEMDLLVEEIRKEIDQCQN